MATPNKKHGASKFNGMSANGKEKAKPKPKSREAAMEALGNKIKERGITGFGD